MKFFIKELRHKQNLSVRGLSKLSRVGKTTIADTENNKRVPCLRTLCKIARALDVCVTELFEMEEQDFD